MIKNKEQRVGVFVDVANMYHSAKNVYKARVNFGAILEDAVAGRKLVRANAYAVSSPSQDEQSFLEALTKLGFDLKVKELQIYPNGVKKADWDVGLSIDAIKLADKVDAIVIVSGDGDYIPLLTYLQESKGCTVEVMAFGETTNTKLKETADDFIDLSKDKRKYLLSVTSYRNNTATYKKSTSGETSIDRAIAAVEAATASRIPIRTRAPRTGGDRTTATRRTTTRKIITRRPTIRRTTKK